MFFKQKFKIFFDDGKVIETDDLLGWIRVNFHGSVQDFYYSMKWLCKYEREFARWSYYRNTDLTKTFFLYTKNNVMISPELFKNEYFAEGRKELEKAGVSCWYMRRGQTYLQYRSRHGRKSHSTTYDRRMETIAERRAIAGVIKEEGEPEFRGRRRCIPNPWDDIMARRSLSWKDCTKRKRQHKGS